VLLTSERHQEALRRLSEHVGDALSAAASSTLEVVSGEIGLALDAISEILGANASEEVLDAIFRRFCIGK